MSQIPVNLTGNRKLKVQMTGKNILKAAKEVFLEEGYYNTTVTKISRRAGVGYGTVYVHYGNKENLLLEIFRDEVITRINNALYVKYSPKDINDVRNIVYRQIHAPLEIALDHRPIMKVVWEAIGQRGIISDIWNETLEKYIHRVVDDIGHSQHQRLARNLNRQIIAKSIVFMVISFFWDIVLEKESDIPQIAENITGLYIHGLYED